MLKYLLDTNTICRFPPSPPAREASPFSRFNAM